MRVGQTSFIVFVSKLLGSVLGFLATLTFARILGPDVIGYYTVILAVVGWLALGGDLGVSHAVSKRISEATESDRYFTAGLVTTGAFAAGIVLVALLLSDVINGYVGVEAAQYVVPLLLVGLLLSYTTQTLTGERKVHIAGLLAPVNLTFTSVVQIALVLLGFGLTGMLAGYFAGNLLIALAGLWFISSGIRRPGIEHFESIYDFAKFSWLGSLKLQSFNEVDILVLGAFVSPSLVGIYAVAWSLSKFLTIFGGSVRKAVFPEISYADATDDPDRIAELTRDSLSFIGLIAIPGLFGGLVIGDRLLAIYGQEFTQGTAVLGLLILATLIYSYQQQILAIVKGIDRPDIAFRVNAIFLVSNLVLNILLVVWLGWVGAALATAISAAIGLVLAYRALNALVDFRTPVREPAYQFLSAGLMAAIVYAARSGIESTAVSNNAAIVFALIGLGAAVYFSSLLVLSPRFRGLLSQNAPVPLPF